jgi:cell fate regulator YaaT (PSP1 superfamily)
VELEIGGAYVVASADGERVGRLAGHEIPVLRPCSDRVAGSVLRRAVPNEVARAEELALVARDALRFCRERARELNVPMRPVSAIVPLDRDTLVITFAAEERVDFRALLRDLGRRTRRRVELRQIGVRDQAKSSGGWGPCGRMLCCSTFMARFNSVTIRMAKAQKLSLNPTRISGMCGRLMCCLAHEAPPEGSGKRPAKPS